MTAAVVTQPTHGVLTFNANGSFGYTPTTDYIGPDSFTYRASNLGGASNTATVTLTVSAPAAPTAADDSYTTPFNAVLSVPPPGVLSNDTSNGGGAMTAAVVTQPTHGVLTFNANGSFGYTPNTDYIGPDSFTYRASNLGGAGNVATVNITVSAPAAPTAADDSYTTPFNAVLNVPAPGVLGNDTSHGGGTMTAAVVSQPTHGVLTFNANGSFGYTPTTDYIGPDSFTYRASNLGGAGNVATVNITVSAPSAPTAADDSYTTSFNTVLTVAAPGVLSNDDSHGGGAMTAAVVSQPTHGVLTFNANGSFGYTPNADYIGQDGFTYRASNLGGPGNVASVVVTIAAPTTPQPPTDLYVASVVGNLVTLRWTPAAIGPEATDFVVEGGLRPGEVVGALATGNTAPIFVFVAPTGSLFVRVYQISGSERSAASNEIPLHVNVAVPPSAPTAVVSLVNGSAVHLAWRNTFAGGPPSSVIVDVTGSIAGSIPVPVADQLTFAAVPAGSYTVSLRAANAAGVSGSTSPVTIDVPAACTGAPNPPENFLFYRTGSTAAAIWDAAATGPAATGYIVNLTGPGVSLSVPTTECTIGGVPPSGTYTMTLVATNPCGSSAPTAAQTILIP
jgi:hypothetical protein